MCLAWQNVIISSWSEIYFDEQKAKQIMIRFIFTYMYYVQNHPRQCVYRLLTKCVSFLLDRFTIEAVMDYDSSRLLDYSSPVLPARK